NAIGKFGRIGDRIRQVIKQLRHFCRSSQISFRITVQQPAGIVETAFVTKTSEYIGDSALFTFCVCNTIGGENRKLETLRNFQSSAVSVFLLPLEMALQFDIDISLPKDADQPFGFAACFIDSAP